VSPAFFEEWETTLLKMPYEVFNSRYTLASLMQNLTIQNQNLDSFKRVPKWWFSISGFVA
jgi:hypothetical protein